ncbi:MAG: DUF3160 domain-containing protein [Candidatus Thorarchaeota archaeon]
MLTGRLLRAIDGSTQRKMMAGGMTASILAVSLVVTLGVFGGIFIPRSGPSGLPSGTIPTIDSVVSTDFANYVPYDESFEPNAPIYSISPGLSNIVNLDQFAYLTAEERALIEANGFVVIPQDEFDQIYEILQDAEEHYEPLFITSDAVLHAFHVCYDLALREAEVYSFWSLLGNLTLSLLDDSYQQYQDAPEGEWKDAALKNVAYFTVAAYLIDDSTAIKPEVASMVNTVLSLISDHSEITGEWFMGYEEDFTQFVPRGHYTRSETLSKYFQAMMWYGRIQFRLLEDIGLQHTPQAILIALLLNNPVSELGASMKGFTVWDAIYQPTVFFVGAADDLLPTEYYQLVTKIYGASPAWSVLVQDQRLAQFITEASELRDPLILGSPVADVDDLNVTKGMRLMGQRFIPDSYILGQLVYKNVGTLWEPRLMPSGLDVMSAFGSERAWALLDDQKHFYNYIEQMQMLRYLVGNMTADDWTQNLYYLWLYTLLPLLYPAGEGYPLFMQNQAWVDKQLYTALGSWTELRHDTILYAKQSYTYRLTSVPPDPTGYVEPVPQLYSRLASLCDMMISGLDSRGLLSEDIGNRLNRLHNFLLSLRSISLKQLSGVALNSTDILTFKNADETLRFVSEMPTGSDITSDTDRYMSVVADVHSDPNTMSVLEEAVGDPMTIIVAVYLDGQVKLARGGTFSYYEFTHPIADRLTDESWREMIDQGLAPSFPAWTRSFIISPLSGAIFQAATLLFPDE